MSATRAWRRVEILGVPIDALTVDGAIERIATLAADPAIPAAFVVKPYVEFLDRATRDPEVRSLLAGADLSLADGVAVQWAATYLAGPPRLLRLLGLLSAIVIRPGALAGVLPARVAGASFTWPLLERAARDGLNVHLVGSPRSQTIAQTARRLTSEIPGLRITGTSEGRVDPVSEAALVERLREEAPDLVLVGLGFPLQERLMAGLCRQLSHGVLVGEGGTFDYREFGGATRRAPGLMRRAGLEWLWRLAQQPSRWRRQVAIPRFVWHVWRASRVGTAPIHV